MIRCWTINHSRQRGAKEIGRADSVSFSAGIQFERFDRAGQKNPKREWRAEEQSGPLEKEPGNGSHATNSRYVGLTR